MDTFASISVASDGSADLAGIFLSHDIFVSIMEHFLNVFCVIVWSSQIHEKLIKEMYALI